MALRREKFLAYVKHAENEQATVHPVTIHHVDQTRAEVENIRVGAPRDAGLNLATCQVWAALTRMGLYTRGYEQFRDMDLVGLEDDGHEELDPTQPGTPEGSG